MVGRIYRGWMRRRRSIEPSGEEMEIFLSLVVLRTVRSKLGGWKELGIFTIFRV